MDSGSSCKVIYEHCFLKLKPSIQASKVDLQVPLVGFLGEKSWAIREVLLEITIGNCSLYMSEISTSVIVGIRTVFSTHESGKTEGVKKVRETFPTNTEVVLSCIDSEEKIIVNNKYPEQTVTIGKQLPEHFKEGLRNLLRTNTDVFTSTHDDMTGIPRTITVNGKSFNTEHKLNEYRHIKPIKQKRRSLDPDRIITAHKEVEEFTREGIL
ncbi:hypothetical protein Tco_1484876 [Tanacetum coccineum]